MSMPRSRRGGCQAAAPAHEAMAGGVRCRCHAPTHVLRACERDMPLARGAEHAPAPSARLHIVGAGQAAGCGGAGAQCEGGGGVWHR